MHAKKNRSETALPILSEVADKASDRPAEAPAKGLSATLGAALGGKGGKAQFSGKLTGAPHHADKLSKARKPVGGANLTRGPRKGHR